MCVFLFAILASVKIWTDTRSYLLQRSNENLQSKLKKLQSESNQILRDQSVVRQRDRLRDRALDLGYQIPDKLLYVAQP